ncbi:MAG: hypothetical protein M3004_06890 [Bacteroidota bacterium]|nr:hypothetical protein [Bacteroidota bacterium]
MQKDGFDYLLTSDKNLQYQQNLEKYSIGFIVLDVVDNNYETILKLLDKIKKVMNADAKIKGILSIF